ncbi:MAG TPA: tRNA (N(6)-L-threonylcarbamoyladenosine(37)-C(2))-methylthiotransferase MtaB [Terriglobales bacterium]|nr:tRNA (N(6)-L-threonylcarbamoyladenosine(37)-C(2))-methylthiotransferase MtaB [Terriglobales bacterium]
MSRFYLENFGCRATQADGAAIERQLAQQGMDRAKAAGDAEVVILNTCTVTAAADQDARAAIRRVHRENPNCRIVVTGCYAQRAPQEIAALPGVSAVIGNSHKQQVAEMAAATATNAARAFIPLSDINRANPELLVGDIFAHTELMAAPVFDADFASERTRPNLKVQDGCDNRCSFCVIPYVRGQSRSLPLQKVLEEVNGLVALGFREVVISGINLGRWGRDLSSGLRFEDLVRTILAETSLERLRLSSIEPMDWSEDLIEMVAGSSRIAKHAHVPMQSGSDRVLRLMHRKYRPWHYADRINKIREAMPDAAIGADVMVGFPGESEDDFEQTRCMVEKLPFTYLHVFTYSPRPGTPAASLAHQVPVPIARERNRILRELAAAKKLAFQRSFVGKAIQAITLSGFDGEYTEALTDNYLKLRVAGRIDANQWVSVWVEDVRSGALFGNIESGKTVA